jgi:hypothetical protein
MNSCCGLLGYDTVQSGRLVPTLQKNTILPPSGLKTESNGSNSTCIVCQKHVRRGKYECDNYYSLYRKGELSCMTETLIKAPCGQLIPTGFIQTLQIHSEQFNSPFSSHVAGIAGRKMATSHNHTLRTTANLSYPCI